MEVIKAKRTVENQLLRSAELRLKGEIEGTRPTKCPAESELPLWGRTPQCQAGARAEQARMHREESLVLKSKSPKVSECFPEVLKSNIHKHIEEGEGSLEKTPF